MQETAWHALGAAVRGTTHQKQGLPCQDAFEVRVLTGGVLAAALADGAGTAKRADQGARRAVLAALEEIASYLEAGQPQADSGWEQLLRAAFVRAHQALREMASEQDQPLRDFATTLICVVAARDRLATGQLGDGAVVSQNTGGELFLASRLQRGEYANETYFLTQDDALELVEVQVHSGPVSALAVMSDGLTRLALKMPELEPHSPFFQPLFTFAARSVENQTQGMEQLAAFLASERVCARSDDDKALILAVWRDQIEQPALTEQFESEASASAGGAG